MTKVIAPEILETFIYKTLLGEFMVSDPLEFDQPIPGGPFETREAAEKAFTDYVIQNDIEFE